MLLLHCPNCNNRMKYQGQTAGVEGKRKRCVYCGRSFKIKRNIVKAVKN